LNVPQTVWSGQDRPRFSERRRDGKCDACRDCGGRRNADHKPAKEPEITDLQNFLNACGAKEKGAGTGEIVISGKNSYHQVEHRVIPDRIEGGTILAAVAITGGSVILRNAMPEHMSMILSKLAEAGCRIREGKTP
jgi:UDP-N-acetylglucosamine enolpyruvyl transferase